MTIVQNALHSFGGDWSWVPPEAVTSGPRDIMGAKHRRFWLDGDLPFPVNVVIDFAQSTLGVPR